MALSYSTIQDKATLVGQHIPLLVD